MALKNIFKLTKRRQGELVGQIYKYIYCYNDFFVPRTRVYLKDLAQDQDTIYWLENPKSGEVTSMAMIEPKYIFELSGIKLTTLGHTLSKIPNQIHNILDHIMGDYNQTSIVFFSRTMFANAMQIEEKYGFVGLDPVELQENWPEFANLHTDYFNLATGESLLNGCIRKGYNIYFKISDTDLAILNKSNPQFAKLILQKSEAINNVSEETAAS